MGTDLDDLECHNSPCFAFFTILDSFAGQLCHMVEVKIDL